MPENFRKAALWVFACGVILRIALALVNTQSNDDHLNVSKIMGYENRIPEAHEVNEAFQPKLYHGTVAVLLKVMPPQSERLQIILAQLISCIAGIFTVLLAYRFFTSEVEFSEKARLISFSLLALNPALIGINAQATNDSFVILFGSSAFYFGWHFFQNWRTTDFCWMSGSAVLAGLSKGNGLTIFLAILAVFVIAFCWAQNNYPRSTVALYGSMFLVSYLALVPSLGPYWKHYRQYGSPFVTNADRLVVLARKEIFRPGTNSMVDGLLTFRFFDMLKNPQNVNDGAADYPLHQKSAWSQLYGRAHSVHFDGWPPLWQVPTGEWRYVTWARLITFDITRLILLFALLPTVLVLTALLRSLTSAGRMFVAGQISKRPLTDWLLDFTTVGYILFLIAYFVKLPDTRVFKAIFIFPAFLAFLMIFARECDRFYAWCEKRKILRTSADTSFAVLLLLYIFDATALFGRLSLGVVYLLLPPDTWNALKNWTRGL
jgi:hypothetical protein